MLRVPKDKQLPEVVWNTAGWVTLKMASIRSLFRTASQPCTVILNLSLGQRGLSLNHFRSRTEE
jgi:hypothetical protein